jgi:hypothetical protein
VSKGERGEIFSGRIDVVTISFRETRAGGAFELARRAGPPVRRYFKRHARLPDTHTGEHFILHPADILLAEDSDGWGCRDAEAEAAKPYARVGARARPPTLPSRTQQRDWYRLLDLCGLADTLIATVTASSSGIVQRSLLLTRYYITAFHRKKGFSACHSLTDKRHDIPPR